MAYLKNLNINTNTFQLGNAHFQINNRTSDPYKNFILLNSGGNVTRRDYHLFANGFTKPVISYPLVDINTTGGLKDQLNFVVEGGLINSDDSNCRGVLVSGKKHCVVSDDTDSAEIIIPINQLKYGAALSSSNGIVNNVTIGSVLVSTGTYVEDSASNGPSPIAHPGCNVIACISNTMSIYIDISGDGVPKLHVPVTFRRADSYEEQYTSGVDWWNIWVYVTAWIVVKR